MRDWLSARFETNPEFLQDFKLQESLFAESDKEEEIEIIRREEEVAASETEAKPKKKGKRKNSKVVSEDPDQTSASLPPKRTKNVKLRTPRLKSAKAVPDEVEEFEDGLQDLERCATSWAPEKRKRAEGKPQFSFGSGISSTPGKFETTNDSSMAQSSVFNLSVSNNSKFEVNPILGKILTPTSLSRLRDEITRFQITGTFTKDQRNQCIDEELKEQLLDRILVCDNSNLAAELGQNTADQIFDLPHDRFFRIALIVYQDNAMVSEQDIAKRISAEILALSGWETLTGKNFSELEQLYSQVATIFSRRAYKSRTEVAVLMTKERSKTLIEDLNKKIRQCPDARKFHERIWESLDQGTATHPKPLTWTIWRNTLLHHYWHICKKNANADDLNLPSEKARKKQRVVQEEAAIKDEVGKAKRRDHAANFEERKEKPPIDSAAFALGKLCFGCGGLNHLKPACRFIDHPDFNKQPVMFLLSDAGKKYVMLGMTNIKKGFKLASDGKALVTTNDKVSGSTVIDRHTFVNTLHPKICQVITDSSILLHNKITSNRSTTSSRVKLLGIPMVGINAVGTTVIADSATTPTSMAEEEDECIVAATIVDDHHNASISSLQPNIKAFLDTGALDYNYISYQLVYDLNVKTLKLSDKILVESVAGIVNVTKYCIIPTLSLQFGTTKYMLRNQKYLILQHCPVQFIIGLPTIRQFDLTSVFRDYFTQRQKHRGAGRSAKDAQKGLMIKEPYEIANTRAVSDADICTKTYPQTEGRQDPPAAGLSALCMAYDSNPPGTVAQTVEGVTSLPMPNPTASASIRILTDKNELLDGDEDDDEVDSLVRATGWDDYFDSTQQGKASTPDVEGVHINAALSAREKFIILASLRKYKGRFKSVVTDPALIPAFEINIDRIIWAKGTKHREYVRQISEAKKAAVEAFIIQALKDGLIELSNAGNFSQVLLTPKANGKWRFCVDYRALNELSESLGWPIPNIKQLLNNIGQKKPKYFSVLDLTSGYYQAPLAKASRPLTAFITHMGLYQWTRVPMGAKGAPPYFQYHMVNTVFAGREGKWEGWMPNYGKMNLAYIYKMKQVMKMVCGC